MRFLKRLGIGLVLLIAAFATVVWFQPDDYRLTRSTTIAAPAAMIFPHINDLHQWERWSPWAKADPNAKITFAGAPRGPGAVFSWEGNDKVGAGTMTITDSRPNDLVRIKTDFVKPFAGASYTEFVLAQTGEQTNVIWTMTGTHSFIAKAMCLVMSMETMLGPDFEKGLAQLKQVSERSRAQLRLQTR
jgi:uncharacterized protein YndB with AHSA1/START domain